MGNVMTKDLLKHHKQQVKMLAYLIAKNTYRPSVEQCTLERGLMQMENISTPHILPNFLEKCPFQGGGYLLLGNVEVDFKFPNLMIQMMAKMPFIPDPRYSMDKDKSLETAKPMHEDVSMIKRKPYPQECEICLPRQK